MKRRKHILIITSLLFFIPLSLLIIFMFILDIERSSLVRWLLVAGGVVWYAGMWLVIARLLTTGESDRSRYAQRDQRDGIPIGVNDPLVEQGITPTTAESIHSDHQEAFQQDSEGDSRLSDEEQEGVTELLVIKERFQYLIHEILKITQIKLGIYEYLLQGIQKFNDVYKELREEVYAQSSLIAINSTLMTDFVSTIDETIKNLNKASEVTQRLEKYTVLGTENLDKTVNFIADTGNKGREIASISRIINEFAERTHVLSINASVQSARSGVAGKGFAIIAKEMRELASNINQASGSIQQMIGNITTAIEDESQLINENREIFANLVRNIEETTRYISNIVKGMDEKNLHVKQLTDWTLDLTKKTNTICQLIDTEELAETNFDSFIDNLTQVDRRFIEFDSLLTPPQDNQTATFQHFLEQINSQNIEELIGYVVELEHELGKINVEVKQTKRRVDRNAVDLPGRISSPQTEASFPIHIHNISSAGIGCIIDQPINEHESYSVTFTLVNTKQHGQQRKYSGKEIHAGVRIAYIQPTDTGDQYRMGLSFQQISYEDICYIAVYIHDD